MNKYVMPSTTSSKTYRPRRTLAANVASYNVVVGLRHGASDGTNSFSKEGCADFCYKMKKRGVIVFAYANNYCGLRSGDNQTVSRVAGIYCQENGPSRSPDIPPLFMNRIVCVLVMILGLLGLISEFVIGFRSKSWWEALLLPVPPFIVTGIWFVRHNPARPFFVGIAALVAAFAVFIASTFPR